MPTEYSSGRFRIANESKFGLGAWDKRVQNKFILTTINTKAIGYVDNLKIIIVYSAYKAQLKVGIQT